MRKIYSLMMLAVLALMGLQANAQVWLVGDSPLGGWNPGNGLALEQQDEDTYSVSVSDVPAGKYFAFNYGGTDWNTNVYRPGSNGATPSGDWETTQLGGNNAWKTPEAGDYTFEFNTSSQQARITYVASGVVLDKAYYITGEFNEWNQTLSECPAFVKDGDVFTLTLEGFSGQFKIRDENGNWLGGAGDEDPYKIHKDWCTDIELVDGKNFAIETAGDYTFTIVDGKLSVTGWSDEPQPEQPMLLMGVGGDWENGIEMTKGEDGKYSIVQAMEANAEFKFKQGENWYGPVSDGNFLMQQEYVGQELSLQADGANFQIPVAGEWTLTVDLENMKLVIDGEWSEEPQPEQPMLLMGVGGDWENGIEMTKGEDGKYSIVQAMEANAEFKFKQGENWYGPVSDGNFLMQQEYVGQELDLTLESGENNFQIPVAGEWTLTVDLENMKAIIDGEWSEEPQPEQPMLLMGVGGDWENGIEMTKGEDGKYSIVQAMEANAEFKFKQGEKWYGPVSDGNFLMQQEYVGQELDLTLESGENNFQIPVAGEWTLTVDLENMKTIIDGEWSEEPQPEQPMLLMGVGGDWENGIEMTKGEDGKYSIVQAMEANAEFKFKQGENWYGPVSDGNFLMQQEYVGQELDLQADGANFQIPVAGEWTLTVDLENMKLVIDGEWNEEQPEKAYYLLGDFNEWNEESPLAFEAQEDGSFVLADVEFGEGGSEFKLKDIDGNWLGGPTPDDFYLVHSEWCEDLPLAADGKNFKIESTGIYTFTVSAEGRLSVSGFEPIPQPEKAYYLLGDFNEWNEESPLAFEAQEDGSFVLADVEFGEGGSEFKLKDIDGNWLGGLVTDPETETSYLIHSEWCTDIEMSAEDAAKNFKIESAGIYTFTVSADGLLSVSGFEPIPQPEKAYYLLGDFNEWNEESPLAFEAQEDGSFVLADVEFGEGGSEFKLKDIDGNWLGGLVSDPETETSYLIHSEWCTDIEMSAEDAAKNFKIESAGIYTFTVSAEGLLSVSGFEPIPQPEKAYYLLGDFNEWNEESPLAFEAQEDGSFVLADVEFGEGGSEFKLKDIDGNWLGGLVTDPETETSYLIHSEWCTDIEMSAEDAAKNFKIESAGIYTFTVSAEGLLSVSGFEPKPVEPTEVYILGNVEGDWDPRYGQMMETQDNVNYAAVIDAVGPDGYSYFSFTTALAENDAENGGWDEIADKRFGAVSEGDFLVTPELMGQPLSLTAEAPINAFKIESGKAYLLNLNLTDMSLTISLRGDINNDGMIDVADISEVIDVVLGKTENRAADINGDGIIDVTDLSLEIDIVLGN